MEKEKNCVINDFSKPAMLRKDDGYVLSSTSILEDLFRPSMHRNEKHIGVFKNDCYRFNFDLFDDIVVSINNFSQNPLKHTFTVRELARVIDVGGNVFGKHYLYILVGCGALFRANSNHKYIRYRINKEWFNRYFLNKKKWSCEKDE